RFPELTEVRRIQACAALNQALALKPDLAQAHLNLGWLYREMGYYDLALKHLRAQLKATREAGPPPGLTAEQFREQLELYEQQLNRLAQPVESQESSFAATAGGLRVLDRASFALNSGLAGKARDVLLASDIAAFGAQGMALELE